MLFSNRFRNAAWIVTIIHESPNAVSSATACRRVTGTPFSSYELGRAAICVRSGAQQAQETDGFGEALERDRFLALWHCLRRTPAGRAVHRRCGCARAHRTVAKSIRPKQFPPQHPFGGAVPIDLLAACAQGR